MPGTWSKLVTVVTGQTITASLWNNEFDNVITNSTPDGLDDASANTTAMQTTTDPYPASVESLATSLTGELQRLRYLVKQITAQTNWYVDPTQDLTTLLPKAGGTMSGNIAMGTNKLTGLGAGSANGDSVRYEQCPAIYSGWASYTPTVTGAGTISGVSMWWRQVGDTVEIEDVKTGVFSVRVCSAPTGTEATPFSATVS